MIKRLTPAAVLFLAACATTSPTQQYRTAGSDNTLKISGEYDNLSTVTIFVNGEQVASGSMGFFGGPFEFSGQYADQVIDSYCSESVKGLSCLVFVDNERAATLTF